MRIIDSIREAGFSHHPQPTPEQKLDIEAQHEQGAMKLRELMLWGAVGTATLVGLEIRCVKFKTS
jgi:hypothetical protein